MHQKITSKRGRVTHFRGSLQGTAFWLDFPKKFQKFLQFKSFGFLDLIKTKQIPNIS